MITSVNEDEEEAGREVSASFVVDYARENPTASVINATSDGPVQKKDEAERQIETPHNGSSAQKQLISAMISKSVSAADKNFIL